MLTIHKSLVLLITVLSIESLSAQSRSIQDSLLLENAFKNKDGKLVTDLLNRWHREDLALENANVTDTALLVKKMYEVFIDKFLQKKLDGYYSRRDKPDGSLGTGQCSFTPKDASFLFLQDQLKYTYSIVNFTTVDFEDYIKWRTDDNGLMPQSVANPDKLYTLDGQYPPGTKQPQPHAVNTIAYQPASDFWRQLESVYGYKAVLYSYNSERQKRLVRFAGYRAMGPGYVIAFTAVDQNSIPYQEQESRIDFLSAVLKYGDECTEIIAGNHPLAAVQVMFS